MKSRTCVFFIYVTTILLISFTIAAPTTERSKGANILQADGISLLQPHVITIERLESLLRRAGEIFRPVIEPFLQVNPSEQPEPLGNLRPPSTHPYNFYLPPFGNADEEADALDEKSRNIMKFTPPPPNSGKASDGKYYDSKPKKLPKKFNAAEKMVNINWLNAFEREALSNANGQIPKAVYMADDERNRINFDDSFFAVDTHVRAPADNNPHQEVKNYDGDSEFTNPEEGEDLVAAPTAHILHLTYKDQKRVK